LGNVFSVLVTTEDADNTDADGDNADIADDEEKTGKALVKVVVWFRIRNTTRVRVLARARVEEMKADELRDGDGDGDDNDLFFWKEWKV
jgi:hypothetical protein